MGNEEVVTAPHSPWQNPFVEQFIGSIRRECLDHTLILNEKPSAARGGVLRPVLPPFPAAPLAGSKRALSPTSRAAEQRPGCRCVRSRRIAPSLSPRGLIPKKHLLIRNFFFAEHGKHLPGIGKSYHNRKNPPSNRCKRRWQSPFLTPIRSNALSEQPLRTWEMCQDDIFGRDRLRQRP